MSNFGKKTTKRISVSPVIKNLVKKTEATSFDAWCKRRGMTTKTGKATKACIKKAIAKSKTTKKSEFGFNPRKNVTRAVSKRFGPTAKKFRQTELKRLSTRTRDTVSRMKKELKSVDKTIEFAKNRGDLKLLQRFKSIRNDIKNESIGLINKDKRNTYKRIAGTFTKGVPKWFK